MAFRRVLEYEFQILEINEPFEIRASFFDNIKHVQLKEFLHFNSG